MSFNANPLNPKIFPSYTMSNLNFKIFLKFVMTPPLRLHLLRDGAISISQPFPLSLHFEIQICCYFQCKKSTAQGWGFYFGPRSIHFHRLTISDLSPPNPSSINASSFFFSAPNPSSPSLVSLHRLLNFVASLCDVNCLIDWTSGAFWFFLCCLG